MIKELGDYNLPLLEASLTKKIDQVQNAKKELVRYEAEAAGSNEADGKELLTQEIEQ